MRMMRRFATQRSKPFASQACSSHACGLYTCHYNTVIIIIIIISALSNSISFRNLIKACVLFGIVMGMPSAIQEICTCSYSSCTLCCCSFCMDSCMREQWMSSAQVGHFTCIIGGCTSDVTPLQDSAPPWSIEASHGRHSMHSMHLTFPAGAFEASHRP